MFGFTIPILLGRVIGLVVGFTIHEWAHAWSAYRLGDNTAYYQGRLTFDPRAHLEPIGIFLALFAGFGWAKPVPVNPAAFYPNEKRGLVIVSIAGPLTNLLLAIAVGVVLRVLLAGDVVGDFVYTLVGTIVLFNLVLFLFNLIPLAPLDGYKIAVGLLPREQSAAMSRYERETTLILMLLVILGAMGRVSPLWLILGPPLSFLFNLIVGVGL
ncbi:MAG: site-2 protease family protein [Chloroflexi bacterium]|nr:site-2 protease family protein [Chloroflexota bacterium]